MQSVKSIIPKKIKTLHCFYLTILVLFSGLFQPVSGQDNSPYSRYGIGDLVPPTSVSSRTMGGLSAAYSDYLTINFNNPASFSNFQTGPQGKTNKISSGRTIFDVGLNFENRTLQESNPDRKFTANNALFSYIQIGVPLRRNWGLSFGLRPISRISYKIFQNERLKDPITGLPIDSSSTRYEGDGGSYLASVGTGLSVFRKSRGKLTEENLSVGLNIGYLFGKKDYASRRSLINDTVEYFQANYQTKTGFGSVYFNAGLQYRLPLTNTMIFSAGAYGSWSQKITAHQDQIRETFLYDANFGDVRLDSVSDIKNLKGKIVLPASYTVGAVLQKIAANPKEGGWLVGFDFMMQNWEKYRIYGQVDSLRNKWELRLGTQLNPVPKRNYFSKIAYRAGLFIGPDYIKVQQKLPQFGLTFGMGLPIGNYNRLSPYQASIINLSFEYIKRGNSDNLLRENLFRISVGFSLSDFWFIKQKYD